MVFIREFKNYVFKIIYSHKERLLDTKI